MAGLLCPLNITIKSHKDPGEVVPRILHNCADHPFQHLGRWISKILRPALHGYTHIARDTNMILRQLTGLVLDRTDMFLKADCKDYYMSGTHHNLAAWASLFAPSNYRSVVKDAVTFLLTNQYICYDNRLYKVFLGSGMGFHCAGEIADCAFIHKVEAFLLDSSLRARLNIRFYARCEDDISSFCGQAGTRFGTLRGTFATRIRRRASPLTSMRPRPWALISWMSPLGKPRISCTSGGLPTGSRPLLVFLYRCRVLTNRVFIYH